MSEQEKKKIEEELVKTQKEYQECWNIMSSAFNDKQTRENASKRILELSAELRTMKKQLGLNNSKFIKIECNNGITLTMKKRLFKEKSGVYNEVQQDCWELIKKYLYLFEITETKNNRLTSEMEPELTEKIHKQIVQTFVDMGLRIVK